MCPPGSPSEPRDLYSSCPRGTKYRTSRQNYCMFLRQNHIKTRLLGRPQPQMYPPVALNQHTLVNRTPKHYIYMLQGPTNILKSHQSSTICKKYVSNLMNIFVKFCFKHVWLNGGPVGGGGASIIRLGPSWFT